MWPASWVSGCPEALEGESQRTQNSWVLTASGRPQEIHKELRRDPEEKAGRSGADLLRDAVGSLGGHELESAGFLFFGFFF